MKKDTHFRRNLYLKFALIVMAGLILLSLIAGIVFVCLEHLDIQIEFSDITWLVVCSLFIGGIFAGYIGKKFFDPITELGKAMSRVAKGDFSVELDFGAKIKEVREIYNDFNLMVKELRATEILQMDFVSNVSHEFKTPITAIEGYATLLQDGEDPVTLQQADYIEKILFNSKRISTLVGNVLLLSKIDNQAIPAAAGQFRLDEQIRQMVFALESEWEKKEIEFEVNMEAVFFTGNEAMMQHVWSNLIGNAIKFSPQQGIIRIELKRSGEKIIFTIEDEGPGIPAESMTHIFDRFYQGDTSHRQEGNGLGLALVKQILTIFQGNIFVQNLPKKGCRFTVEL